LLLILLVGAAAAAQLTPKATETAAPRIKKVFLLFSNHLDMGYTLNKNGSSSGAVINQ
jgi:hypothetical protein